ncbi:ABC transporter ATP-binding protein [Alicyclobacillus suci]|uniref:ABC transporter ATP-binding protein n=1 Tax=Alicyclobacillus suci TaxID=2816080 RepID=UPI001A8D9D71|nr:ABC transporter ATP-binding protein [Alicyclobacillus suci]
MSVNRRLLAYAAQYKRTIWVAIAMLALSVAAQLGGPFVAKMMIDRHILGIERTWYEVPANAPKAVAFRGHWYERGDYLAAGEPHTHPVTLLEVGRSFYFVQSSLPFTDNPTVHGHQVTVRSGDRTVTEPAIRLTARELFAFYQPEVPGLWRLAILYFLLLLGGAGFAYGQQYLLQISANKILQRMRREVFAQIQRLPIRYFDTLPAGKVVSRITNDTEAIRDFYVTVAANMLSSIITMAGIYIAMFILSVQLGLICLTLLPILAAWIIFYRKYAVGINHRIRALLSDINAMINETIQGVPVIRAFNRANRTQQEFDELNATYYDSQIKLLRINSATSHNLAGVLRNAFLALVIALFGWRAVHGAVAAISFGMLYAFVDYLSRLFQPVVQLVNQLSNLEQARVSAERVFELLDEPGRDVVDGEMARYRGRVEFEHVTFSYDGEHDVLKDLSFVAEPGQTVALVGHTGSGKSSIINLLFRFYDATRGRILVDGMDITEIPPQHLRKHMGIVLQDPFLFTGTIASNVSLGDESISRARVEQALRDVGADRLLAHLPNGFDEPVLEHGSTLSAGQRQLISFARALAFDPAILVLDEATSSIDTETEAIIQDALDVLKRGRTTFIIAHRLSTIRTADQILVLDGGVVVERGTHDELMRLRGRYYQMYQLQQGNVSA